MWCKLGEGNLPKLLIIDDEPGVRRSLEMIASTDGWETLSCDQFADVVGLIREKTIDVLVCDYRMPPFTGIQIIQQIRDAGLRLPVVMITANPDNVDRRIAGELEVREILRKPPNVKDVRAMLADAAAQVKRAK
jgi:two-component system phosphate regulon response regulator OmpR